LPTDHEVADGEALEAVDLEHGMGFSLLAVRRSWAARETLNTHFGPGWSDPNLVRLASIDKDHLLIWRGGRGWRSAHRQGDLFATSTGVKIRPSSEGWTLEISNGNELNFDRKGRLSNEKTPEGCRTYAYDGRDRLVSIEQTRENKLTYVYDETRDRVSRVEGPEGLQVRYQYDEKGRLAEVVNSRKV
jgi:YD repeat-containing protein